MVVASLGITYFLNPNRTIMIEWLRLAILKSVLNHKCGSKVCRIKILELQLDHKFGSCNNQMDLNTWIAYVNPNYQQNIVSFKILFSCQGLK